MGPEAPIPLRSKPHFWLWALLYAGVVVYASTFVTITGVVFVPRDPEAMFWKLVNVKLVTHGSDQRADWMGNLGMLIPLGFLLTAALLPAPRPAGRSWGRPGPLYGGVARRIVAACAALVLCFIYIIVVKYAQLFSVRTVNLNYIIAQTSGASIGILACVCGIDAMTERVRRITAGTQAGLVSLLQVYTLAVLVFVLAPFDVVLSADDVAERLASLPQSLFAIPGADRPLHLRALIVLGGAAMLAPVGLLLQATLPDRPLRRVAMLGLLLAAGMTLGSMTILGAAPSLFSVPLRWLGMLGGAVAYRWLRRHGIAPLRPILPWLAAAAVLPYLLALLVANSLLPLRWRSMVEIWAVLDPRFFLPFWTHYMVPKAQAIKSVAVHALMYMPLGVMIWAWFGGGRWQTRLALGLGFVLAATMEIGRLLTPGLMLDLNNAAVGALAAAATAGLMRMLWIMVEGIRPASDG